jgi:hypothetical protein
MISDNPTYKRTRERLQTLEYRVDQLEEMLRLSMEPRQSWFKRLLLLLGFGNSY